MILICANHVWPQSIYPTTVQFPVTYYDFHSDGSCPDFTLGQPGMGYTVGAHPGMIQDTLDKNGLPLLATDPAKVNLNAGIARWFAPWQPGQESIPVYNRPSGSLFNVITVNYDTAYKNIMFTDTLQFTYVPGSQGVFEYADTNFFPLDNRGFSNEGKIHNYSFAVAMHRDIQYKSGLIFNFQSHDDMWVFLNKKLVVDRGGLDSLRSAQLNFDNVPGLKADSAYPLDVFWSQRSGGSSSIKVSTSIVPACPCGMSLEIRPHNDTTIASGDSLRFEALILGSFAEIHHEYDTLLAWSVVHDDSRGRLGTTVGSANVFYSNSGTGPYRIVVTCTDITKFPASWPLLNRSDTVNVTIAGLQGVVKRPLEKFPARTLGKAVEYYNLRGQKLPLYGIHHSDGIVLERVIEPTGKMSVRKKLIPQHRVG